MSRRALVTGASGFVGPHLVRRLLADGWEVGVVARSSSGLPHDVGQRCRVVPSDVDQQAFLADVQGFAPDVCFHLATHFVGVHGPADVDPLIDANLRLGTRLADALSTLPDVAFVNVGTVWQHHDGRAYGPTSLYAATKQAFVDVLQFFAECTPLRVVTVELSDTYGPDDHRVKLLQLLVRAHRTGEPLLLSPGEQLVDLVHVADVVDALIRAVPLAGAQAPCYAVGGEPMAVRDYVALVGELLGAAVPVEWGARPYRPREMMRPWRHFPRLPGWQPAIGLREGLSGVLHEAHTDA
jgi:nucleoside-diphosphate-sugar epimerase